MFFHTEAWALPIGPQAKACGLLDNARQRKIAEREFQFGDEPYQSLC
ncbi:MAG: hypothetical protein OYL97_02410 [Candidatus Poribacteria bacterium]|nr:hypothetical protein [Candidatus Poribacteria bacterium]MDE0325510.1 hypothetical protein [Candidatus Poribacteria bacterium]MDE0465884.1 hypothetical protein [Candidatus Poribacteria bacterium]